VVGPLVSCDDARLCFFSHLRFSLTVRYRRFAFSSPGPIPVTMLSSEFFFFFTPPPRADLRGFSEEKGPARGSFWSSPSFFFASILSSSPCSLLPFGPAVRGSRSEVCRMRVFFLALLDPSSP